MKIEAKQRLLATAVVTAAPGQAKQFRKALLAACAVAVEGPGKALKQALATAGAALKADLQKAGVKCKVEVGSSKDSHEESTSCSLTVTSETKNDYGYIQVNFVFLDDQSSMSMFVEGGEAFSADYSGAKKPAPLLRLANKLVDRFEKYGFNLEKLSKNFHN